jgi:hypothetical protein
MRRRSKGRSQWRFIVGLSVLGLLIIASASHAAQPVSVNSASSLEQPVH